MDVWQELAETLSGMLVLAVPGAIAVALSWWLTAAPRPALFPPRRIRRISWKGIDVFAAMFVFVFVTALVHATLEQAGFFVWLYGEASDPSTRGRQQIWSASLAVPLVLGLIVLGLGQLRGTVLSEYGLSSVRLAVNLRTAYFMWLLLTPLTLALNVGVILWLGQESAEPHPVSLATKQGLAPVEWILMVLGTAILVPLLEELLFRGVLLGWQLRGGPEAQATVAFCALFFAALMGGREDPKPYQAGPILFMTCLVPLLLIVPYAALRGAPSKPLESPTHSSWLMRGLLDVLRCPGDPRAQPALAVLTNAMFFAAVHGAVWPSPIPLFILALGLAWLRYRSASLVGPVLVHALFNGVTVVTLFAEQYYQP